jgi:hypothetical protein
LLSATSLAETTGRRSEPLVYMKGETRESTRAASIKATLAGLPALQAGPWYVLGKAERAALQNSQSSTGAVDLSAPVPGPSSQSLRWKENALLQNGRWEQLEDSIRWMYRTVEVTSACVVTISYGVDVFTKVYLNGVDQNSFATTAAMEDRMVRFTISLKAGVNHLLILIHTPTPFYFDLSPLNPALLAQLESRLDTDFPPEGESRYYRIETVPVPEHIVLEVGGIAPANDGALMIATRRGELWRYSPSAAPSTAWHLFASGLHEPLGIVAGQPGEYFLCQRPELTRVADADHDAAADHIETLSAGEWQVSGNHHEYVFGPVRDSKGNLYGVISGIGAPDKARRMGWSFRYLMAERKLEFISTGFRSSNGIAVTPEDDVFVADNQGEYVGTSPLHHVTPGAFHGHPAGLRWHPDPQLNRQPPPPLETLAALRKPPAILFPYGVMGHSLSQPLVDTTGGKFGPFAGQMFIGDQSKCTIMRVAMEKVDGEFQGACFPFRSGFQSGNNRLYFAEDGSLYVGQTDRGWGAIGGRPYGLQRVVWTGETPLEISTMKLTKTGFDLAFTKPLDPGSAADAACYTLSRYHYAYRPEYGSPKAGETPVAVTAVRASADARGVSLDVPELVPGEIYELTVRGIRAADGSALLHPSAYYTLNRLLR